MTAVAPLFPGDGCSRGLPVKHAIASILQARFPSRELDAVIAKSVFPALAELQALDHGIWLHGDGSRVRALHYTRSREAAATLVPAGFWIESYGRVSVVAGPAGDWSGHHEQEPIALCLAALRSRTAPGPDKPGYPDHPKET